MEEGWENGKLLLYLADDPILEISETLSGPGTKVDGHCELSPQWRDHLHILNALDRASIIDRKRREDQHTDNVNNAKPASDPDLVSAVSSPSMTRVLTLTCDPIAQNVRCYPIYCHIKSIPAQTYYHIKLRARLWNSTLIENYFDDYDRIDIQSFASLHINDALIFQTLTDNDNATVRKDSLPEVRPRIRTLLLLGHDTCRFF